MKMSIKRVYEAASENDGRRILVDRLWPRGLSKERAKVDLWLREIAPSTELRTWSNHDPEKWDEFRRRYFAELDNNEAAVRSIREGAAHSKLTLLFAARDVERNNAVALQEYLSQNHNPST